jgi:hypothetical protein
MYEGETTEEIIAGISDLIDGLLSEIEATGPQGFAIKQAVMVIVNTDNIHKLMSLQGTYSYPGADCSGCGETVGYAWEFHDDLQSWTQTLVEGTIDPNFTEWSDSETWFAGEDGLASFYVSTADSTHIVYELELASMPQSDIGGNTLTWNTNYQWPMDSIDVDVTYSDNDPYHYHYDGLNPDTYNTPIDLGHITGIKFTLTFDDANPGYSFFWGIGRVEVRTL